MVTSRALRTVVRSGIVTSVWLCLGCLPSEWRARSSDAGTDTAFDAVEASPTDAVDVSGELSIDVASDAGFDGPSSEVAVGALDGGADEGADGVVASIDVADAPTTAAYRVNREPAEFSRTATPASVPELVRTCGRGSVIAWVTLSTGDPNDASFVAGTQMQCLVPLASGGYSSPSDGIGPANPGESAYDFWLATARRLSHRCPDDFVMVGIQGEHAAAFAAASPWVIRMGMVCARWDAWLAVSHDESLDGVGPNSAFFEESRAAYAALPGDAGAPDAAIDAGADDALARAGSDTLPALPPCTTRMPSGINACAHPIVGGRPDGIRPDTEPYFVTCPGALAVVGHRSSTGRYLENVQLQCGPIERLR